MAASSFSTLFLDALVRHGRITARAVGYWVSTGLLASQFLLGGLELQTA